MSDGKHPFPLATAPHVIGKIVKPAAVCICGARKGWKLLELHVFPLLGPSREEQRTVWGCNACGERVRCHEHDDRPAREGRE